MIVFIKAISRLTPDMGIEQPEHEFSGTYNKIINTECLIDADDEEFDGILRVRLKGVDDFYTEMDAKAFWILVTGRGN